MASGDKAAAGLRLAGMGDRLIAVILDALVIVVIFAVVGMWVAQRWGGVTPSGFQLSGKPALVAIGLVGLVGFIYYWLLEGLFGATLGKGIVGIRVQNEGGGKCTLGLSLTRNLLRIIDGIAVYLVGFLIAVFSKRRQRLGDHLAHTVVVETEASKAVRAVLVVLWLVILIGGIWGAYIIHQAAPSGAPSSVATSPTSTPISTSTSTSVTESVGGSATIPVMSSGDIKILNFTFAQAKDGPPRPLGPYKPKDKVYTSYEFAGFTTDAQGEIHASDSVAPLDPAGLPLYSPTKDSSNGPLGESKTVKNSFWFDIPLFAPPGTYKIQIKVHDAVKNTDAEFNPTFTVEASPLPISEHLEIRDLALSLTADGPPASPAVTPPGNTIYMSGKLAGVQFRDDRADVHIAFQVFGPKGEKLLDRPDFLTISDSFPYHPPTFFIPISGNLSLPSSASKGTYTEKYMVTDRVANTTVKYDLKFEVR